MLLKYLMLQNSLFCCILYRDKYCTHLFNFPQVIFLLKNAFKNYFPVAELVRHETNFRKPAYCTKEISVGRPKVSFDHAWLRRGRELVTAQWKGPEPHPAEMETGFLTLGVSAVEVKALMGKSRDPPNWNGDM